jgi:hypothetical protein
MEIVKTRGVFNNNHLLTRILLVYTISISDDVLLVFNNNHLLTCIPLVYTISISDDEKNIIWYGNREDQGYTSE